MVIGFEPGAAPDPHCERLDLWDTIGAIPPHYTPYPPRNAASEH